MFKLIIDVKLKLFYECIFGVNFNLKMLINLT